MIQWRNDPSFLFSVLVSFYFLFLLLWHTFVQCLLTVKNQSLTDAVFMWLMLIYGSNTIPLLTYSLIYLNKCFAVIPEMLLSSTRIFKKAGCLQSRNKLCSPKMTSVQWNYHKHLFLDSLTHQMTYTTIYLRLGNISQLGYRSESSME